MLIQSILYGSVRYWLFSCWSCKGLHSDAYQLTRAKNPVLQDSEVGSSEHRTVGFASVLGSPKPIPDVSDGLIA